jgi:hypothetical protein
MCFIVFVLPSTARLRGKKCVRSVPLCSVALFLAFQIKLLWNGRKGSNLAHLHHLCIQTKSDCVILSIIRFTSPCAILYN